MSKAKKVRSPSERVIEANGKIVRLRTIASIAEACGVSRITAKRTWQRFGLLPTPTMTDATGTRWYSEDYIRQLATIVKRFHKETPRGKRRLRDLKFEITQEWRP